MRILHVARARRLETAFVQGAHDYLVPVAARPRSGRPRPGPDVGLAGVGARGHPGAAGRRAESTWWCCSVRASWSWRAWLAAPPGRDVPPSTSSTTRPQRRGPRHPTPLADRDDLPIVHVTHFNALMWDSGRAPTTVIEHGIVDPGYRYTGELAAARPCHQRTGPPRPAWPAPTWCSVRPDRARSTCSACTPTGSRAVRARDDLPQAAAAPAAGPPAGVPPSVPLDLARPVADRGDAPRHAGGGAGHHRGGRGGAAGRRRACSNRIGRADRAVRRLLSRPGRRRPRPAGWRARPRSARFGLDRFLHDWDRLLRGGDADEDRHGVRARQPAGGARRCRRGRSERPRRGAGQRAGRAGHDVASTPGGTARPAGPGAAGARRGRRARAAGPGRADAQGRAAAATSAEFGRRAAGVGAPTRPDVVHAHFWMSRAGRAVGDRRPGHAGRADLPRARRRSSGATRAGRTPARPARIGVERALGPRADRDHRHLHRRGRASWSGMGAPRRPDHGRAVRRRPRAVPPGRPERPHARRPAAGARASAGWCRARASTRSIARAGRRPGRRAGHRRRPGRRRAARRPGGGPAGSGWPSASAWPTGSG